MVLWIVTAQATTPVDVMFGKITDHSLLELTERSPLIFIGVIESISDATWVGHINDDNGQLVTLRVTEMWVGEITSGRVMYWDTDWNISKDMVGETLIVFGGPKVLPVFTYEPATWPAYEGVPAYEDVVVPMFSNSVAGVSPTRNPICFVDGEISMGIGPQCPGGNMDALEAYVKSHSTTQITLPGAP